MTRDIDLIDALETMLPRMRKITVAGWLAMLGVCVVVIGGVVMAQQLGDARDRWNLTLFLIVGGAWIGAIAIQYWTKTRHQREIMPSVAKAMGFRFSKDADEYLSQFPKRMLPKGTKQSSGGFIIGEFDGRRIKFAEARISTGGDNDKTLFSGSIAEVSNIAPLPVFYVGPVASTQGGIFTGPRILVEDLVAVQSDALRLPDGLGLWITTGAARDPALMDVVNRLVRVYASIGPTTHLFSLMSDREKVFAALQDSAKLFDVGGLFTTRQKLMNGVAQAVSEFRIPLTLLEAVGEAEEAALTP